MKTFETERRNVSHITDYIIIHEPISIGCLLTHTPPTDVGGLRGENLPLALTTTDISYSTEMYGRANSLTSVHRYNTSPFHD